VDEAKRKELVRIGNLTASVIPGFKAWMDEFMESPEHLEELCSKACIFL